MNISPKTSLVICVVCSLLTIAAFAAGKWLPGLVGVAASVALWGIHYKSFMVD